MVRKLEKIWMIILFINGFSRSNTSPQSTPELVREDINTDQCKSAVWLIPLPSDSLSFSHPPLLAHVSPTPGQPRACKNLTWCDCTTMKTQVAFRGNEWDSSIASWKCFQWEEKQNKLSQTSMCPSGSGEMIIQQKVIGDTHLGQLGGQTESCAVSLPAPLLNVYC